jgi:hypothetical protein
MHNPNLSLDTQEFRGDGFKITCPIEPFIKQPELDPQVAAELDPQVAAELDPQVAAVLEAADGCPYRAGKITKAVVLALRPLDPNGIPPTFPLLKLIDSYLDTCSKALLNNLKAAPNIELQELNINLIETNNGFEASVSMLRLEHAADPEVACLKAAAKLRKLAEKFETLAIQENPRCKSTIKRVNEVVSST